MKKKLLIGAVVALFLGAGVFTATSLTQKEQISDLTLANIEAMTQLPEAELVRNCKWLEGGNCEVPHNGTVWDNSNMVNRR